MGIKARTLKENVKRRRVERPGKRRRRRVERRRKRKAAAGAVRTAGRATRGRGGWNRAHKRGAGLPISIGLPLKGSRAAIGGAVR